MFLNNYKKQVRILSQNHYWKEGCSSKLPSDMLARKDNHLVQRSIVIPSRCWTALSIKYIISESCNKTNLLVSSETLIHTAYYNTCIYYVIIFQSTQGVKSLICVIAYQAWLTCFNNYGQSSMATFLSLDTCAGGGVKVLFLLMPIHVVTEAKRRRSE